MERCNRTGGMRLPLWRVVSTVAAMVLISSPPSAHAVGSTVTVNISDTGFTPNRVTALVDKPVHIHVVNQGRATHQFSIPYFRIYTQNLAPGAANDVEFAPWTTGEFDMTSDPKGANKPEFQGKFVVAAAP